MIKNQERFYLVIVAKNDPYELPQAVCDTMQECADVLGCSIQTLYNHKEYNGYEILIVKDVEEEA